MMLQMLLQSMREDGASAAEVESMAAQIKSMGGVEKFMRMMQGVDVGSGELAEAICADCFKAGLIIETSGAHDEVVKVLCPLTIERETLTQGLDILEAAVAARASGASTKLAAE